MSPQFTYLTPLLTHTHYNRATIILGTTGGNSVTGKSFKHQCCFSIEMMAYDTVNVIIVTSQSGAAEPIRQGR